MNLLRIRNLTSPHLDVPQFDVGAGECVAVMGPSGAGKSLLLRAIADLDPHEGEVLLEGRSRKSMPAWTWRREVMLVPAESGWWADRVGAHFLADRSADEAVLSLGLPSEALGWDVARLSSGERHRLAIARALCFHPKALMLDEPSASLDAAATERLEAVLQDHLSEETCLVLVTHDRAQAERLADRTVMIEGGRMISSDGPAA